MIIRVYLSGKLDWDLIKIKRIVGNRYFNKMAFESLRMIVDRFFIPSIPPLSPEIINEMTLDREKGSSIAFWVNEKKSPEIVGILDNCPKGRKSFLIKAAIRIYLGPSFVLNCILNKGINKTNNNYIPDSYITDNKPKKISNNNKIKEKKKNKENDIKPVIINTEKKENSSNQKTNNDDDVLSILKKMIN